MSRLIIAPTFTRDTARDNSIDEILANRKVTYDVMDAFLGELIGNGAYRNVYENRLDSKTVIKIETGSTFANAIEFETWQRVCMVTGVSKWFAPIQYISGCGKVLIMAKCKPLKTPPAKIPSFFTDVKMANFGLYQGRVVCLDYGSHLLMEEGMKLKLINWTSEI